MTKRIEDMTPEELEAKKAKRRLTRNKALREWRRANPEKVRAAETAYKARNKDTYYPRRNEADRKRWAEQPEEKRQKNLERQSRWGKENREKLRIYEREKCRRRREKARMNKATSINQIEIYRLANAAVPRGLVDRDYVISDLVMAVLDRKIATADIPKRAGEFIRAHNRENDHYKTVSLDECLPGTDLARLETITAEDLPW